MLEKPGKFPSERVGADSLGAWLPADTKWDPRLYPMGGGEGHRGRLFSCLSVKLLIFVTGQPWPVIPCRLSGRQQAARYKQREG